MDIDADYILANFNINMKILMTEIMIWCLLIYLVIIRVVKLIIKLYRLEIFDNINILNNFNNVVHFIVHFISFLGNFNKVSNFIEFAVKIMNTLRNFNNTKVVNFPKNFVNFSDINNLKEFYNFYDKYVFNNDSLISTSKVLKDNFNYSDYYDIFDHFYILENSNKIINFIDFINLNVFEILMKFNNTKFLNNYSNFSKFSDIGNFNEYYNFYDKHAIYNGLIPSSIFNNSLIFGSKVFKVNFFNRLISNSKLFKDNLCYFYYYNICDQFYIIGLFNKITNSVDFEIIDTLMKFINSKDLNNTNNINSFNDAGISNEFYDFDVTILVIKRIFKCLRSLLYIKKFYKECRMNLGTLILILLLMCGDTGALINPGPENSKNLLNSQTKTHTITVTQAHIHMNPDTHAYTCASSERHTDVHTTHTQERGRGRVRGGEIRWRTWSEDHNVENEICEKWLTEKRCNTWRCRRKHIETCGEQCGQNCIQHPSKNWIENQIGKQRKERWQVRRRELKNKCKQENDKNNSTLNKRYKNKELEDNTEIETRNRYKLLSDKSEREIENELEKLYERGRRGDDRHQINRKDNKHKERVEKRKKYEEMKERWKIYMWNARGLVTRNTRETLQNLQDDIGDEKILIVSVVESWFGEDDSDEGVSLEGFNIYRADRKKKIDEGGAVI